MKLKPIRSEGVLIVLDAKAADGKHWNKLFPLGVTKHHPGFGKIEFTQKWCEELVRNAKDLIGKGHRIQGNYHHFGGLQASPEMPLESTIASGWIHDIELREDGPYALIEWTARAKGFIDAKELLYLSPEFWTEFTNRDTGKKQGPTLIGFALTNVPFLKELPPLAAAEQSTQADPPADTGAKRMDKKLICALLGLAEDVADTAVLAKLKELAEAGQKLTLSETKVAELVALKETAAKLTERVAALEKDKATLLSENATFLADKKKTEVTAFFDDLVREGKLTPASRASFEKLALQHGLESVVSLKELPVAVPMGERGIGAPGASTVADAQKRLDARVAELRKADTKLTFTEAHQAALSEMPEVAKALYSEVPKTGGTKTGAKA